MKVRAVLVSLLAVYLVLFAISSAIGEPDFKSVKRILCSYLIDDFIQKCQSKMELSESRSANIRKAATLAALKAEYLSANKDKLIDQMLDTELSLKKYKVRYFLNAKFFNYYASKSKQQKVIEAKVSN